jgi:hypothetical protein
MEPRKLIINSLFLQNLNHLFPKTLKISEISLNLNFIKLLYKITLSDSKSFQLNQ